MILNQAMMHHNYMVARKFHERVEHASHRAKHFVFDDRASALIGAFIDQCSDLVLKHRQFAKPPYETTYIEFDAGAMYEGKYGIKPENDTYDDIVGYLIDGHWLYVVSQKKGKQPILWPVFYYMGDRGVHDLPKSNYPVMLYGNDANWLSIKTIVLLGHKLLVTGKDKEDVKAQLERDVYDIVSGNEAYWGGSVKQTQEVSRMILAECTGDVRTVWAGLLWLQSMPKTVAYSGVPGGARLYKGKRVPVSAHHVVSIHLKPKAQIRREYIKGTAKRDSPRWHEVRGHYKHKGDRHNGCSHEWPDTPDETHIFVCKNCGLRRWWSQPHSRGDRSKGIVSKDYSIDIEAKHTAR